MIFIKNTNGIHKNTLSYHRRGPRGEKSATTERLMAILFQKEAKIVWKDPAKCTLVFIIDIF